MAVPAGACRRDTCGTGRGTAPRSGCGPSGPGVEEEHGGQRGQRDRAADAARWTGRLDPAVDEILEKSGLHNEDLAPVPIENRTWTTYSYLALWVGMAINVPTWLLAAGLGGIKGWPGTRSFSSCSFANVIVLIPMLLISHAGTKYGIPFPVVRSSLVRDVPVRTCRP